MKKAVITVLVISITVLAIMSSSSKNKSVNQLSPCLALKVDIPELLNEVEKRNPDKPALKQIKSTISLLDSIELKNLELLLFYLNENLQPLIHVKAPADTLQKLAGFEAAKKIMTKREDGSWLIKTGKVKLHSPVIAIELDGKIIAGTEVVIQKVIQNPTILSGPVTARLNSDTSEQQPQIILAADIGNHLDQKIEAIITKNIKPDLGFIAGVLSSVVKNITSQLDNLNALALSIHIDGDNRQIRYSQSYRNTTKATQFINELNSPDYEPIFDDSVRGTIAELFQEKGLKPEVSQKGDTISYLFNWKAVDDKNTLNTLGKSTIGAFMNRAMMGSTLTPSKTPVLTEVRSTPVLDSNFQILNNLEQLKSKLQQNTFLKDTYSGSVQYQFSDTTTPNLELTSIEWKITAVKDAEGQNIQTDAKTYYDRISSRSGTTRARYKKDDKIKPKSVTIEYCLKAAPSDIQEVWLDKNDIGKIKKIDGGKIALQTLENNVVKLKTVIKQKHIKAFSYNKDGFCLDTNASSSNSKGYAANMDGSIEKVQLILYNREKCNKTFSIDLPIAAEETKPSDKIVVFNKYGAKINYSDQLSDQFLNSLKVKLENEKLILDLKNGQFDVKDNWKFNIFGKDSELNSRIYPSNQRGRITAFLRLKKNPIKFISGTVDLSFRTAFTKITLNNSLKETTTKLKDGTDLSLKLIDNRVELKGLKSNHKIVSVIGFNNKKQMFEIEKSSDKCEFWGIPQQVELVISSNTINKSVPFEFEVSADYDQQALSRYKAILKNEEKLMPTLKSLAEVWKKTKWEFNNFPGIAGLYYLSKNGKQLQLISKEMANSDPMAAQLFGYTCRPFMGYHFTFPKTAEGKPTLTEHKRSYLFMENGKEVRKEHTALESSVPILITPAQKGLPAYMINNFGQIYRLNGEGYQCDTVSKKSFPKDAKKLTD